jgi:hypothetical protein
MGTYGQSDVFSVIKKPRTMPGLCWEKSVTGDHRTAEFVARIGSPENAAATIAATGAANNSF